MEWLEGDEDIRNASGVAIHSSLAPIFHCHLPPGRAECFI
eukprot:SAG11_NODE_31304_length_293_cov_0.634021_1_plen_39_part_10